MAYRIPHMPDELTGHSERTAELATEIAAELGYTSQQLRSVWLSAYLHDVGKLNVPSSILDLPRALTEAERVEVERHPHLGHAILDGIVAPDIAEAVLAHHERVDGLGYPFGLAGDRIPQMARIISVADAVDAIVSERVYQAALPLEVALLELSHNSGTQFDPNVVVAAYSVLQDSRILAA